MTMSQDVPHGRGRVPLYEEPMVGVNLPLPPSMKARIDTLASKHHMARTAVMRLLLDQALNLHEARAVESMPFSYPLAEEEPRG